MDPLFKFVTKFCWSGIFVEPHPEAFAALRETYRQQKPNATECGALRTDGSRILYTVRTDGLSFEHSNCYSSFDRDHVARQSRWLPDIATRIKEIPVRCISMQTLVAEAGGRIVDILVIDTEGYDSGILKMVDFQTVAPTVICYEHAHLTKSEMTHAARLLAAQGYRMTRDNLDTLAYRPAITYGWR